MGALLLPPRRPEPRGNGKGAVRGMEFVVGLFRLPGVVLLLRGHSPGQKEPLTLQERANRRSQSSEPAFSMATLSPLAVWNPRWEVSDAAQAAP